jgi:hypothetical protein
MSDLDYEDDYDRHYRKIKRRAVHVCNDCDQSSPDAIPIHAAYTGDILHWLCPACYEKQLANRDAFFRGD